MKTDVLSILIWIQTIWHFESVPEKLILNKDDNKNMNNYPAL